MERLNLETKGECSAAISNLRSYLDEAFSSLFGDEIERAVKRTENLHAAVIASPAKVFLLSGAELEHSDCATRNESTTASWWLRSPLECVRA